MQKNTKPILLICLVVLVCALAFSSCDNGNSQQSGGIDTTSNEKETVAGTEQQTDGGTVEETTDGMTQETTGTTTEETTTSTTETSPVEQQPHAHTLGDWTVIAAPSCTEKGEQKRSCACGYSESDSIEALGHSLVVDEAVEPTCDSAGLTEGAHCSVCHTTIVAQSQIPAKNHVGGEWIVVTAPTTVENGLKQKKCELCKTVLEEEIILATGSVGLAYEVNSDGQTCTVTGIGSCTDTHVVIPSAIDGYTVTKIANRAFEHCLQMTAITLPDTIKTIGNGIFNNATNLHTVYYNCRSYNTSNKFLNSEYITKLVLGGSYMDGSFKDHTYLEEVEINFTGKDVTCVSFENCTSLKKVKVGGNVCGIPADTFQGCVALTDITLGASVTRTGFRNVFSGCAALKNVYYEGTLEQWCNISFGSSYDSNPLYYAEKLYIDGKLLTDVVIPESVTSIGQHTFFNWTWLESITLHDGITKIKTGAFKGCVLLDEIALPKSLESIGSAAFDSTAITNMIIPESVTSIGAGMFRNCTSLKNVKLPTSILSIPNEVFKDCVALEELIIPNLVESIGNYSFEGCTSLSSVIMPDSVTTMGINAFRNCAGLESIKLSDKLQAIQMNAFDGCRSLKGIEIPASVTSIGDYAFANCVSLEIIDIPDTVTSAGAAIFCGCSGLKSFKIGTGITELNSYQVASHLPIDGMFEGCTSLVDVVVPDHITKIGKGAFSGCSSIKSITLPFVGSSTNYGDQYNDNLNHLSSIGFIFGSDEYEGSYKVQRKEATFYVPSSLETVTVTGSMAYKAFKNCSGIKSIIIGDDVPKVPVGAFTGCSSLTSICIGASVDTIPNEAFIDSPNLECVKLGAKIEKIGDNAFKGCLSVKKVEFAGDLESWLKISFGIGASSPFSGDTEFYIGGELVTDVIVPQSVQTIGKSVFPLWTAIV